MSSLNQNQYQQFDDYAQSANTLFHFMKKLDYLKDILFRSAIVPRYCIETIDYLKIHNGTETFDKIAVLQKCFCDIPFHKLADSFALSYTEEEYSALTVEDRAILEKSNTHFDYYGEYAIGFSKSWGEAKNLQPIHYVNEDAQYAKNFRVLFEHILQEEDFPDNYAQDIINRLSIMKPLRGSMQRTYTRKDSSTITINVKKNFHDECEWRYVPNANVLHSLETESVIANQELLKYTNEFSNSLQNERFKDLWLDFSYDDIRYIVVPSLHDRIEIINTIIDLDNTLFKNQENILMQKYILISKILVLSEIRKDW